MSMAVLDVLFPRTCAGCGGGGWPFCPRCRQSIAHLSPPGCVRCGRPTSISVASCAECPAWVISWCRAPLLYDGPVRSALMRLKFGGGRAIAAALGEEMARYIPD